MNDEEWISINCGRSGRCVRHEESHQYSPDELESTEAQRCPQHQRTEQDVHEEKTYHELPSDLMLTEIYIKFVELCRRYMTTKFKPIITSMS